MLAPLPRKNKKHTSALLSVSTQNTGSTIPDETSSLRGLIGTGNAQNPSLQSSRSPRISGEFQRVKVVLYREDQRVSLRAFLCTLLQNEQIAESKAMDEFLTSNPVKLNLEELDDVQRRKDMDEKRIEEQRRFYEVARERARELDIYMERFRRDVIESSMLKDKNLMSIGADKCVDGLTKLFKEIKEKERISDLSLEFQKFAEWLRIESVLPHQLCICLKQNLIVEQSCCNNLSPFPRRR